MIRIPKKRKDDSHSGHDHPKSLKISTADGQTRRVTVTQALEPALEPSTSHGNVQAPPPATETAPTQPQRRIKKLVPPRPFPIVPTSVSATGPRSAHTEGKNYICITRKTSLGAYLRRCKNVIMKDGYKTLHLSAMGAAIPHLAHLALSLPPILPFAADEIHTEITTGTVEVQDEVIPDDEEKDIGYQTRGKSTLLVVLKIGDGEREGDRTGKADRNGGAGNRGRGRKANGGTGGQKGTGTATEELVYQEPEQDDMVVG